MKSKLLLGIMLCTQVHLTQAAAVAGLSPVRVADKIIVDFSKIGTLNTVGKNPLSRAYQWIENKVTYLTGDDATQGEGGDPDKRIVRRSITDVVNAINDAVGDNTLKYNYDKNIVDRAGELKDFAETFRTELMAMVGTKIVNGKTVLEKQDVSEVYIKYLSTFPALSPLIYNITNENEGNNPLAIDRHKALTLDILTIIVHTLDNIVRDIKSNTTGTHSYMQILASVDQKDKSFKDKDDHDLMNITTGGPHAAFLPYIYHDLAALFLVGQIVADAEKELQELDEILQGKKGRFIDFSTVQWSETSAKMLHTNISSLLGNLSSHSIHKTIADRLLAAEKCVSIKFNGLDKDTTNEILSNLHKIKGSLKTRGADMLPFGNFLQPLSVIAPDNFNETYEKTLEGFRAGHTVFGHIKSGFSTVKSGLSTVRSKLPGGSKIASGATNTISSGFNTAGNILSSGFEAGGTREEFNARVEAERAKLEEQESLRPKSFSAEDYEDEEDYLEAELRRKRKIATLARLRASQDTPGGIAKVFGDELKHRTTMNFMDRAFNALDTYFPAPQPKRKVPKRLTASQKRYRSDDERPVAPRKKPAPRKRPSRYSDDI